MYFADRGCVRNWRNLYRYATAYRFAQVKHLSWNVLNNNDDGVINLVPDTVFLPLPYFNNV